MKEYSMAIFAVCATVSVLGLLSYRRGDAATRTAMSVLVLYVTLMPILESITGLGSLGTIELPVFDPSEYGEEFADCARDAFSEGIKTLIVDKYSLDGEDVRVTAEGFDFENMRAERIRVVLTGSAALGDGKGIAKYVSELGYGRCEVEIGVK
jgi:hypothetical protein